MTYQKPEIELLGDAVRVIQSEVGKANVGDAGSLSDPITQDFELQ
jgi:hypothetical protein